MLSNSPLQLAGQFWLDEKQKLLSDFGSSVDHAQNRDYAPNTRDYAPNTLLKNKFNLTSNSKLPTTINVI